MKRPKLHSVKLLRAPVIALVGGLIASTNLRSQTLLNVNFAAQGRVKMGFAATGNTANDFWNPYTNDHGPYPWFTWLSNLKAADGSATTVGLTVQNGVGVWSFTHPDLMYQSYIYSQDYGNITLTVTNLPGGQYDFYLYGHDAANTGNTVFQLLVDEADYGNQSTATNSAWALTNWVEGAQYVVYRNVFVTSGGAPVTIVAHPGQAGTQVNGMQIAMSSPEIPLIKVQPRSQVGYWGKSVGFTVSAIGAAPLAYQWQLNAAPIPGATAPSLVLTNLQVANAGNYSVVVSNAVGSTTSSNAYLSVNPAGVTLALYSGVTIDGVVGLTYGIQYSTNLSNPNGWQGAANVMLGAPTQLWFDFQPATQPQRYYRVVPGPIPVP